MSKAFVPESCLSQNGIAPPFIAGDPSVDQVDLGAEPGIRLAQPPQGYLAPGRDPLEQALAAAELAQLVGEFEKPKFFAYNAKICAHSRSAKAGCNNCIDTCSTGAIAADGDGVKVEPHLCMGCGGCATVWLSIPIVFSMSSERWRVRGVESVS